MAKKCFVIQPFDGGDKFDKRYKDVFSPAIGEAGLVPYRVDHDPQSVFPNEDIRNGIRDAVACLADITMDNINVGVEIGIAITLGKDPVIVCSEERKDRFPFDIQDRRIISYKTDSPSDFSDLRRKISEQLRARLSGATTSQRAVAAPSVIATGDSLDQHEFSTLVEIGAGQVDPDGVVSVYVIRKNLSQRYHELAVTISLGSLYEKGFIEKQSVVEGFEEISAYGLTPKGWKWMHENKSLLPLDKPQESNKPVAEEGFGDMEDIPF